MNLRTSSSPVAGVAGQQVIGQDRSGPGLHIVDQLIRERSLKLSKSPLWPLLKPVLYRVFHYDDAVRMADHIAQLSGREAFDYLSELLSLDLDVSGTENIPASGGMILAPNHPTGIADGIAIFDSLKNARPDMAIFANRDALRVSPGFSDLIIPVEWRPGEKTHAKSRDTLERMARAFSDRKAVVLFPSGRIAYWSEGRLTERPWQTSAVALARRFGVPLVPTHISARNSGLFYLLARYSTELRDMTVFHELLNKKRFRFSVRFGRPIAPDQLEGDVSEVTGRLQHHTVTALARDGDAVFAAPPALGQAA